MTQVDRRGLVAVVCGGGLALVAVSQRLSATLLGSPDPPVTRGRGAATAFGSVAVLRSHRHHLAHGSAAAHRHQVSGFVPVANRTWSEVVRVDVELHNGTASPVLSSPGQFRLRVGRRGPTVTPYQTGRGPGALAPGSTTRTWVSYLVPAEATQLWVEYAEASADTVLAVRLHPARRTVAA